MQKKIASIGLMVGLTLCFACKDPEGACEAATDERIPHCGEGKKSYCEEGRVFHEGRRCFQLGYTRKDGITWFRPLPRVGPQ